MHAWNWNPTLNFHAIELLCIVEMHLPFAKFAVEVLKGVLDILLDCSFLSLVCSSSHVSLEE